MDPLKDRDNRNSRYSRYSGYNGYDRYGFPKHGYLGQIIKYQPLLTGSPIHKPKIRECCYICGKSLDYCGCRYEEIHYNYHYY